MQLSLRGTLLILVFVLAILPMSAIGVVSYLNLVGSVEDIVEQRTLNAPTKWRRKCGAFLRCATAISSF